MRAGRTSATRHVEGRAGEQVRGRFPLPLAHLWSIAERAAAKSKGTGPAQGVAPNLAPDGPEILGLATQLNLNLAGSKILGLAAQPFLKFANVKLSTLTGGRTGPLAAEGDELGDGFGLGLMPALEHAAE